MTESCRAELIAVGSEILLGQINNSHAQVISQTLAQNGLYVFHHSAVGDNQARIVQAFAQASARSNVVIVTGGLGPTVDDLTKESLAEFLQRQLYLSEDALAALERFFANRKRPMPEENRKQAYCIEGGEMLPNPNGTAPGQYIYADGVHYFLLPGPPLEMRPMLEAEVLPRLRCTFATQALVSRVVHFAGIGESDVDEAVRDLTGLTNPTVAPLASEGEMVLRITASADTEDGAWTAIRPLEATLRARFPDHVYGVDTDTLAIVVGRGLCSMRATLAVAESCTGGLLGQMLTAEPGASAWFRGGVIAYDNGVKARMLHVPEDTLATHGAVSGETAKAMAEGVRRGLGADYGVAITGIAGPGGGTPEKPVGLVFIGVAGPQHTDAFRITPRGSREQIRLRAAKYALWRLWRALSQQ